MDVIIRTIKMNPEVLSRPQTFHKRVLLFMDAENRLNMQIIATNIGFNFCVSGLFFFFLIQMNYRERNQEKFNIHFCASKEILPYLDSKTENKKSEVKHFIFLKESVELHYFFNPQNHIWFPEY